jgi:RimJ/RimL family protein N-acetyltransferase
MNIELRSPKLSDAGLLLSWRNEPLVRKFSKNQELISEDSHKEWLEKRISTLRLAPFFIFYFEESPVGYVRFDCTTKNEFDISYLIDPKFRGKGLGIKILLAGIRELNLAFPTAILNAWVSDDNLASQKTFEVLRFSLVETKGKFRKYRKLL